RLSGQREEDNELHLPYWAELWDSGLGLAQFLVTNTDKLTRWQGDKVKQASSQLVTLSPSHPVKILDIGCGMGLAGMAAAAMGAKVLLADLETHALLFAR